MKKPESTIDGANVLYWAWSGNSPFGWLGTSSSPTMIPIFGLAIAQYDNSAVIYRFSCNEYWETRQDGVYETIEDAMKYLPKQYREVPAKWQKYDE